MIGRSWRQKIAVLVGRRPCPHAKGIEGWFEPSTSVSEFVGDCDRRSGVDLANDQARLLELTQSVAEHSVG